jgi:hypothetical protein
MSRRLVLAGRVVNRALTHLAVLSGSRILYTGSRGTVRRIDRGYAERVPKGPKESLPASEAATAPIPHSEAAKGALTPKKPVPPSREIVS